MKCAPPARAAPSARRTSAAPRTARPAETREPSPASGGFLLDGCPCGGICPRCKDAPDHDIKKIVRVSAPKIAPALVADGKSTAKSWKDLEELFVDGDGDKVPTPAPKTPPKKKTPPPPSGCPTDIKVAGTGNLQMDASFAEGGILTGFGGFAIMEVSDPGGKNWAGTAIHENLKNVKNTCGLAGACSNAQGEGGAAGSTFKVGDASNLLGILALPSKKNSFYDQHMIIMQGVSALHKAGKPSCEIQCEQTYDCGGRVFGPTFLISYLLKQATVTSEGKDKKSYNVTTVDMNVAAKP